jgi:hypothetical protein
MSTLKHAIAYYIYMYNVHIRKKISEPTSDREIANIAQGSEAIASFTAQFSSGRHQVRSRTSCRPGAIRRRAIRAVIELDTGTAVDAFTPKTPIHERGLHGALCIPTAAAAFLVAFLTSRNNPTLTNKALAFGAEICEDFWVAFYAVGIAFFRTVRCRTQLGDPRQFCALPGPFV